MNRPIQLPLFLDEKQESPKPESKLKDFGTFKDSMRAPIHGWFKYPAGYSYKFVEYVFDERDINPNDWVYDPFSGTGTTLVCAKSRGINGFGIEAHAFVHWVARTKLFWGFDYDSLRTDVANLLVQAERQVIKLTDVVNIEDAFPELIYKCYHPRTLRQLYVLREYLQEADVSSCLRDLAKLALTDTLRGSAAAGTGWPYISPRKNTGDTPPKDAFKIFKQTLQLMCQHLYSVGRNVPDAKIHNILGDSRNRQNIDDEQIDLALTSPPYLNNYDYADRTRLETYFWGITSSWGEITELYRDKLIVAATTQIIRSKYEVATSLSKDIQQLDQATYETIQGAILQLSEKRLTKGGKKSYDLMVALYFNDMLQVLKETWRVLKPGASFYLVLGDSAPYGVHIPTENIIGRLGLALGFTESMYIEFRKRGGKWKDNPQRHNIQLREGALILTK